MKRENHDAFRRSGLGPTARRIWELLNDQTDGLTVQQIASALGKHPSTVDRNLKKLRTSGLTRRGQKIAVWRSLERNLDDVAAEQGTLGARDRQRIQHHRERETFALSRVKSEEDTRSMTKETRATAQEEESRTVLDADHETGPITRSDDTQNGSG